MDYEKGGETYDDARRPGHLRGRVGGHGPRRPDLRGGQRGRVAPTTGTSTARPTGWTRRRAPRNFVTIDHGNGWVTSYLHMRKNSVAVEIGDVVKAGEAIGLVGSSGMLHRPAPALRGFPQRHHGGDLPGPVGLLVQPRAVHGRGPGRLPRQFEHLPHHRERRQRDRLQPARSSTSRRPTAPPRAAPTTPPSIRSSAPTDHSSPSRSSTTALHEPQEQFKVKVESLTTLDTTWTATVKIIDNDRLLNYVAAADELTSTATRTRSTTSSRSTWSGPTSAWSSTARSGSSRSTRRTSR